MKTSLRGVGGILAFCTIIGALSCHAQSLAEALDNDLTWTTGGDAPWFAQTTNTFDLVDAVRSGVLQSNQTSWLETTVTGPTTVIYYSGSAFLGWPGWASFTVNNEPPPSSAVLQVNENGWVGHTYDLGAGVNVLRWSFRNSGAYAAFTLLDDFQVHPARPLAITYLPPDQVLYSGETLSLYVYTFGTPPIYYQWRRDNENIPKSVSEKAWRGLNHARRRS